MIEFHPNPAAIPFFRVRGINNVQIQNRIRELGIDVETISTFTIDDVLLGPLNDVGVLERAGAVDLKQVYFMFGEYVDVSMSNHAIQEYIRWARQEAEATDIYRHLEGLYQKLEHYATRYFRR